MKFKISDYFSVEFIKFLTVSTVAAGVNFVARIVASQFTGYGTAVVIAFVFGLTTAFTLNKFFVFKKAINGAKKQFVNFTIVNLLALPQTLIFSVGLNSYLFPAIGFQFHPEEIAHIIGIGIPIFTSFLGHKYFSFKKI